MTLEPVGVVLALEIAEVGFAGVAIAVAVLVSVVVAAVVVLVGYGIAERPEVQ